MEKIVLQKYLSNAGLDSRRKCENFITQNRVKINGEIAHLGSRVLPNHDIVTLDDKKIELTKIEKIYIMLNKPRGFVTTLKDRHAKRCVTDLLQDIKSRIYPVGRLDKDSEGLLIFTNDGDFANSLIHPSKNIWKTYRVTLNSSITEQQLISLSAPMEIEGIEISPSIIEVLIKEPNRTVLSVSIKEGKNRQIRKMCENVNLEVIRLKRVSIGHLKLGMLQTGKWRNLTKNEIKFFNNNNDKKLMFK